MNHREEDYYNPEEDTDYNNDVNHNNYNEQQQREGEIRERNNYYDSNERNRNESHHNNQHKREERDNRHSNYRDNHYNHRDHREESYDRERGYSHSNRREESRRNGEEDEEYYRRREERGEEGEYDDRRERRKRGRDRRLEREQEFIRNQLEKKKKQSENPEDEEEIKIPLGLLAETLEPSSLELLTEEKMKAFSVGVVKKSAAQKAKEELEAKKKRTEDEAAKVYEEFVKEFSGETKSKSMFIRGETINNSQVKEAEGDREYNMQANFSKPTIPKEMPSSSQSEATKKKRQIDELREELQRKQEVEVARKQIKIGFSSNPPTPSKTSSSDSKEQKAGPIILSYPPSPMMPPGNTNSSEPVQIRILPIDDLYELATINMLASLIVEDGFIIERAVMEREKKNVKGIWRFLFQGGNSNNYYRWKIYSLMQGDSIDEWKQDSFQMYKNGPVWIPPPMRKQKVVEKRRKLNRVEKDFFHIVENLTINREYIKDAMGFALDHTDHAEEIVNVLTESFLAKDLTISSKIARLFLTSDILWNSGAPVPKASTYRTFLEPKLPLIFQSMSETYRGIKGRITSQNMKDAVLKVLRLWAEWSLYPSSFTKELSSVFLEGKNVSEK